MGKRIARGLGTALLVAAAWAGSAFAQPQSQAPPQPQSKSHAKEESLGDAARKARGEKGKSKPGKVYTEEDLSGLGKNGVSVVGQETPARATPRAGDSPRKPETSSGAKPGKSGEEYWRGRARKLREQMAAVDREIQKVKNEIEKAGRAGFDVNSGLTKNIIYYFDRKEILMNLEKRKEELRRQIDLLEDEARRAGVPPGWLR